MDKWDDSDREKAKTLYLAQSRGAGQQGVADATRALHRQYQKIIDGDIPQGLAEKEIGPKGSKVFFGQAFNSQDPTLRQQALAALRDYWNGIYAADPYYLLAVQRVAGAGTPAQAPDVVRDPKTGQLIFNKPAGQ